MRHVSEMCNHYNYNPFQDHLFLKLIMMKPNDHTRLQEYTLFFLFLFKKIVCEYSLEPPRRSGSNEYLKSTL